MSRCNGSFRSTRCGKTFSPPPRRLNVVCPGLRVRRQGDPRSISSPPPSGEAVGEKPAEVSVRSQSPHRNKPAGRRACPSQAHAMPRAPPRLPKASGFPAGPAPHHSRANSSLDNAPPGSCGDGRHWPCRAWVSRSCESNRSNKPPHVPSPPQTQPTVYSCTNAMPACPWSCRTLCHPTRTQPPVYSCTNATERGIDTNDHLKILGATFCMPRPTRGPEDREWPHTENEDEPYD